MASVTIKQEWETFSPPDVVGLQFLSCLAGWG